MPQPRKLKEKESALSSVEETRSVMSPDRSHQRVPLVKSASKEQTQQEDEVVHQEAQGTLMEQHMQRVMKIYGTQKPKLQPPKIYVQGSSGTRTSKFRHSNAMTKSVQFEDTTRNRFTSVQLRPNV